MLNRFHPTIGEWFRRSFGQPTAVQTDAWDAILGGAHTLIAAPTGSGKTLAALLPGLDALASGKDKRPAGVRLLYITPLKALNNDIHHHVISFAAQLNRVAEEMGDRDWPGITAAVRTGDTPQTTRASMLKRPPDMLVTTPESLYLLLQSERSRSILRTVSYIIVDEIHNLPADKRGAHLSLSLERLAELCAAYAGGREPQRIGVSATQKPLSLAAEFLAGYGNDGEARPATIVESPMDKTYDVLLTMPDPRVPSKDRESVWLALTDRLMQLMGEARTALIFVNNRRLCERLVLRLNDRFGEGYARSHHGSVSKERRLEAERMLKDGELRCLVATSSLELGIDVGYIGIVLQIDSPLTAASGIQRIGRAGHGVGDTSVGRIVVRSRSQLPEAAVLCRSIRMRDIEPIRLPDAPLDVLAQQLTAMAAAEDTTLTVGRMEAVVRRSAVYRGISREQLTKLLAMLSGYYPFVRPLLDWNRENGAVTGRSAARMAALMGTGTIPSNANFPVYHAQTRIQLGDLEEEFVHESNIGDVFQLGAHSWMIREIRQDRVIVDEAVNRFSEIPFWRGDGGGRSFALGERIGQFVEELQIRVEREATDEETILWLGAEYGLDARAGEELLDLVRRQGAVSRMPTHRSIVAEIYRDLTDQTHLVLHNYWGRRVNRAWLMALQHEWAQFLPYAPYGNAKDNGIEFIFRDFEASWIHRLWNVTPERARKALAETVPGSAMFAGQFRRMAETSLLLQRCFARVPSWQKRIRAEELLRDALPFAAEFPLFRAALDECLDEHLDVRSLEAALGRLISGDISLITVESDAPSPLAAQFTADYVAQMLYEGDAPNEELQRQLLSVSHELAGSVFGPDAAARRPVEPEIVEAEKKRLAAAGTEGNRPEELLVLLKRRGDLSLDEIAAWGGENVPKWLAMLEGERKIAPVEFAGDRRWIARDELETYRAFPQDAHSVAFVLLRWIDSRIAFTEEELRQRYALDAGNAREWLKLRRGEGRIVPAPFAEPEESELWSSSKVSSRMVRLSLASVRHAGRPVPAQRWMRLLLSRHGLASTGGATGIEALKRVMSMLQGLFLPVSQWESIVLPARLPGYRREELDMLCASGELTWVGRRMPGEKEGRIAFFFTENAAMLGALPPPPEECAHPELLALLRERGASFLTRLSGDAGLPPSELLPKLIDLVWEGRVANDSFAPLRNFLLAKGKLNPKLGSGLGRWYAIEPSSSVPPEECALAWVRQLLQVFGLITKEIVAQHAPYNWDELLPVLKKLEEWGMLTRGLFIDGLPALQFMERSFLEAIRRESAESAAATGETFAGATAAAVADDSGDYVILSAADPANPYGAALPWPDHPSANFARKGGNHLIFLNGVWIFWFETGAKHIVRIGSKQESDGRAERLLPAFRQLLRRGGMKRIVIQTWNGRAAADSAEMQPLLELGAERDRGSLVLWPSVLK
jgi:ATP-dependent helicase Lhr and Lhr-like helicase